MTSIIINARFRKQTLTGVQRFATEVASIFAADPEMDTHEVLPRRSINGLLGHAWEQFALPTSVRGNVLFSPANTGPVAIKRQLVVIHDAAVWDRPEGFTSSFRQLYQWLLPRLAKRCRIATVSQFSRQRLSHHLGLREDSIPVFGNAVSPIFQPTYERSDSGRPYLLCVGSLDPRKNFLRLIEAWRLVCESGKVCEEVELRIAGSANPRTFMDLRLPAQSNRVRWVGKVTDAELVTLYQNARAFVFPSIYEGFGIPPLEAMACGCPVLMSAMASMPEVGGDAFDADAAESNGAAIYFDPYNAEQIAHQLEMLLTLDDGRLAQIKRNGLRRAGMYSWSGIAEKVRQTILDEFG